MGTENTEDKSLKHKQPELHENPAMHGSNIIPAGPAGLKTVRGLNAADRAEGPPTSLHSMTIAGIDTGFRAGVSHTLRAQTPISDIDGRRATNGESQQRNSPDSSVTGLRTSKSADQPNQAGLGSDQNSKARLGTKPENPEFLVMTDIDNSGSKIDILKARQNVSQTGARGGKTEQIIFTDPFKQVLEEQNVGSSDAVTTNPLRLAGLPGSDTNRDAKLVRRKEPTAPKHDQPSLKDEYGAHEIIPLTPATEDSKIPTMRLRELKATLKKTLENIQNGGYARPEDGTVGFIDAKNPNSPFIDPRKFSLPEATVDVLEAIRRQAMPNAGESLLDDPFRLKQQDGAFGAMPFTSNSTTNNPLKVNSSLKTNESNEKAFREELALAAANPEVRTQANQAKEILNALRNDPGSLSPKTLEAGLKTNLTEKQKEVYEQQKKLQSELVTAVKLAKQIDYLKPIYEKHHWEPDSAKTGIEFLKELQVRQKENPEGVSPAENEKGLVEIDKLKKEHPEVFASKESAKLPPDQQKLYYDIERLQHDTRTQLVQLFGDEVGHMAIALYAQQDRQGMVTGAVDQIVGTIGRSGGILGGMDSDSTGKATNKSFEDCKELYRRLRPELAKFPSDKTNEEFSLAYEQGKVEIAKSLGLTGENLNKWAEAHDERYQTALGVIEQTAFWGTIAACQLGVVPSGGTIEIAAPALASMAATTLPKILESETAAKGQKYEASEFRRDLVSRALGAFPAAGVFRALTPVKSLAQDAVLLGTKEALTVSTSEALSATAAIVAKEAPLAQKIGQMAIDAVTGLIKETPKNAVTGLVDGTLNTGLSELAATGDANQAFKKSLESGTKTAESSVIMAPLMGGAAALASKGAKAWKGAGREASPSGHSAAPDMVPHTHSDPPVNIEPSSPEVTTGVRPDTAHSRQPGGPHGGADTPNTGLAPQEATTASATGERPSSGFGQIDNVQRQSAGNNHEANQTELGAGTRIPPSNSQLRGPMHDMSPTVGEGPVEQHRVAPPSHLDHLSEDQRARIDKPELQKKFEDLCASAGEVDDNTRSLALELVTNRALRSAPLEKLSPFMRLTPDQFKHLNDGTPNGEGALKFLRLVASAGSEVTDNIAQSAYHIESSKLTKLSMDDKKALLNIPSGSVARLGQAPTSPGENELVAAHAFLGICDHLKESPDAARVQAKALTIATSKLRQLDRADAENLAFNLKPEQLETLARINNEDATKDFLQLCRHSNPDSPRWEDGLIQKALNVCSSENLRRILNEANESKTGYEQFLLKYGDQPISDLAKLSESNPGVVREFFEISKETNNHSRALNGSDFNWDENNLHTLFTLTTSDLNKLSKDSRRMLLEVLADAKTLKPLRDDPRASGNFVQLCEQDPQRLFNVGGGPAIENAVAISRSPLLSQKLSLNEQNRLASNASPMTIDSLLNQIADGTDENTIIARAKKAFKL